MSEPFRPRGLFHVVEAAQVVLRRKGVFYQAPIYQRDGALYAKAAGGYIELRSGGKTTHPDFLWDWVDGVKYDEKVRGLPAPLIASPPQLEHQP
jgi:hypothetical protein